MDALLEGLRGAAEPTRLRLLALLAQSELTVSELTHILGLSQPRISRHLKLMSAAGLIDRFKEGAWVFYRLAERGEGAHLARTIISLFSQDDPELGRDLVRLDDVRHVRSQTAEDYFRQNAAHWDRIRSLYVSESDVEHAICDLIATASCRSGAGAGIGQLVDFGTGTGRILEVLGPFAQSSIGLDANREMLVIARTNLERAGIQNWQVRHQDILSVALEDGVADVVTIHQVLHYLSEPDRVIGEAARILKPGGRLLVVDFAPHDLEFLRQEHAHRRLGFSRDEVENWCRAAGLQPLQARALAPRKKAGSDKLTVLLWLAEKKAGRNANRAHRGGGR
jgi:ArsR family transcriptional regulator